jgi:dUTP pyrophosphatase
MQAEFIKLDERAIIPTRATEHSAGYDLHTFYDMALNPGQRRSVTTGIRVVFRDKSLHATVRSRSGLALKYGVHVLNSPGTIDSDYEGELCVILHNASDRPYKLLAGGRIAQLVFERHVLLDDVVAATRQGGFGSTGA